MCLVAAGKLRRDMLAAACDYIPFDEPFWLFWFFFGRVGDI